jgi:sporulation protein YlmC with PRC-barrel domain
MIEINIGAVVESEGREVGRVERVLLDRDSHEVTHLVLRRGGPLDAQQLLMPLGWVARAAHDRIRIERTAAELANLPRFEVQHYARLDELNRRELEQHRSQIKPADWVNYVVPLVANAFGDPYHTPGVVVTEQMLEPSERAIRRGLTVESSDGHKVGEVHEMLLSEPDRQLSGLVIGRGFVLTHDLCIPADWITRIETDRIVLNRLRRQVEDYEREQRESSR